jgi:hypothetical protein
MRLLLNGQQEEQDYHGWCLVLSQNPRMQLFHLETHTGCLKSIDFFQTFSTDLTIPETESQLHSRSV